MDRLVALFLCAHIIRTSAGSVLLPCSISSAIPMIFQFGDSLSDTGNKIIAFPNAPSSKLQVAPPYGMTYFHHPANRISDGRLIVDFIASSFGLPFLNPYLANTSDHKHGVNFAVAGATALSLDLYKTLNPYTFPLGTQLEWFLQFKSTVPEIFLKSALYIVGEIGGNDYFLLRRAHWKADKIHKHVDLIVQAIENHTRSLYAAGGRKFLMVNLPVQGCNPIDFEEPASLDELGCIARIRELGELHNVKFREMVEELRKEFRDAWFVVGDFHQVSLQVLENPQTYGFKYKTAACCGIFTSNMTVQCGDRQTVNNVIFRAKACTDPSEFVFWNDVHFTEHFNEIVAETLVSQLDQQLHLKK